MAQKLFTTFRAAVESFPLGEQNIGLLKPGRYNGYDVMNSLGGLSIEIAHSGFIPKTLKTGTPDNLFGALLMPTGIIIHDTDKPNLSVAHNSGNPNKRTDFVICEHEYQAVQGGTPANYSIVQGPNDGSLPILPNPEKQVLIGRIEIKANGYQYNDLTYYVEKTPLPGDLTYDTLTQIINESVNISDASTSEKGIAMLATPAETQAGNNTSKIVTPGTLSTLTATENRRGLAEIATQAEVLAGNDTERYITPKTFKDNIVALGMKKELLTADKTLTAEDNGKVFVTQTGTGGIVTQIIITVPAGLPNDFHVGVICGTRSAKFVPSSSQLLYEDNKLPEIKAASTAMLLESYGNNNNVYFVIGNLKNA